MEMIERLACKTYRLICVGLFLCNMLVSYLIIFILFMLHSSNVPILVSILIVSGLYIDRRIVKDGK